MNTFALATLAASTMALSLTSSSSTEFNMIGGMKNHFADLIPKKIATEYVFDKLEAEDGELALAVAEDELASRTEKYPAATEFYADIGDILDDAARGDEVVTTGEMNAAWDDEHNAETFKAARDLAAASADNAETKKDIIQEFGATLDGKSARGNRVVDYLFAKLDGEDQVLKKDVAEKELTKWGKKSGLTNLTSYIAGGLE